MITTEKKLLNNIESKTTPKLFSFRPTTIKGVLDAVKSLKLNKPLGPCSTPAWAIKDGMTEIVPHLTIVINECLKDQKFPSILKKGLITPLLKKRSTEPFELQTQYNNEQFVENNWKTFA